MPEIRRYPARADLRSLAATLEAFFQRERFETQWFEQGEGYLVTAKQMDTVRFAAGVGREATVSLMPSGDGTLVTVDRGAITSQAVGGVLGYALLGPIGIGAAGYGAYKRHQLANEIFDLIEREIARASGGSPPEPDMP